MNITRCVISYSYIFLTIYLLLTMMKAQYLSSPTYQRNLRRGRQYNNRLAPTVTHHQSLLMPHSFSDASNMGFPSQTTLLPSPFILDNTHVRNEHFHLTVVDEKLEVDYRVADERHSDGNSHGENLEALSAPTRFDAIARIKCCVEK